MTKYFSLLLLFAFFSMIFCSTRNSSNKNGTVTRSSSSSPQNQLFSIEVTVDFTRPAIQADGKYSEFVTYRCLQIFRESFERDAVSKYTTCPFYETIFMTAFEHILLEMSVDIQVIFGSIIPILAQEYSDRVIGYLKDDALDRESVEFQNFAKILVIFVQECHSTDIKLPKHFALVFLEFIYRFSQPGYRYGFAFQSLYTDLSSVDFIIFYEVAVRFFNPERIALPVLYVQTRSEESGNVKTVFKRFLLGLYDKVTELDPIENAELYNRHACILISSMLSCNFYEEFLPNLFELLKNVDLNILLPSARFVLSSTAILQNSKDQTPQPAISNYFATLFVQDSVILALDDSNFLNYGAVIFDLETEGLFDQLSIEAKVKLLEIENKYENYSEIVNVALVTFSNLTRLTNEMDIDYFEHLCGIISQLMEISNEFFLHQQYDASNFTVSLLQAIPQLVKDVIFLPVTSEKLSLKRFKLFVRMLQLGMSGPAVLSQTNEASAMILFYYSKVISNFAKDDPEIQSECNLLIELLFKMTKGNKFFTQTKHQSLLYIFLQSYKSVEEAEKLMKKILLESIVARPNKLGAISETVNISSRLNIHPNEIIILYLSLEFQKYLQTSPIVPLKTYQLGQFHAVLRGIIDLKILSKTEDELIKKFCEKIIN